MVESRFKKADDDLTVAMSLASTGVSLPTQEEQVSGDIDGQMDACMHGYLSLSSLSLHIHVCIYFIRLHYIPGQGHLHI